MAVISVTLAHASLCGSRATRMMHKFVLGEKYLTAGPVRVSFVANEIGSLEEEVDVLVSEDPTAPQPASPKWVMMLCLSAAQTCLLESSSC